MGLCTSSTSTSLSTAKLILLDGKLLEFSYPLKVSFLLSQLPHVFICNSDDMDFHSLLTPLTQDHELQPGELYFVLPLSKLSRPLPPDEMAALAVKANAALLQAAGGVQCRSRKITGFFSGGEMGRKSSSKVEDLGSAAVRSGSRNMIRKRNDGRRRMLLANLSVIRE